MWLTNAFYFVKFYVMIINLSLKLTLTLFRYNSIGGLR